MKQTPATIFVCTNCDAQFTKWTGRCLECGKWGTVKEEQVVVENDERKNNAKQYKPAKTQQLADVEQKGITRITTTIGEFDRVLGGGVVPGSYILLGGEPGVGKSTLALQLATLVNNVLYISGEESVEQIHLRAMRLGRTNKTLKLANEANLETIIATIQAEKPALTIIDSIQTMYSNDAEGEPGNIGQVRVCAAKLLETAKSTNCAIVVIGHITKDGALAGPKTLEHLVDTVLYLEGDQHHGIRILRATKNRFGSTDEIGMFDMAQDGLVEVKNPSALLLEERGDNMPGSVVTCLMEGTRPILVEIQALVNKTTFGYPVRKASGFDINRLHVLIAVLQKRAGLNLGQYDVHVNVVGGIKANEPAADLSVALAIASAYKDKALGNDLVVFGEVGLGGEIRSVRYLEKRLKESEHLGMKRVITILPKKMKGGDEKIKMIDVKNIQELIKQT